MSEHTPGQWDREAIYWVLRYARKNDGPWSDERTAGVIMPDEGDAALIASAPDLLEALQFYADKSRYDNDMTVSRGDGTYDEFSSILNDEGAIARAAIAKAKGETR
jgi:hypothetical protein